MHRKFLIGTIPSAVRADFDPVTLRLFIAVCEEGSIVRAADRESIVPSAVSKRMAALEAEVALQLLHRGTGGMVPTEAGQTFFQQARQVLGAMDRMHVTMRDLAHGGTGSVRILASLAALSHRLPADLIPVLQEQPSLRISLREAASSEMVKQVKEGAADLAVCWDAADLTGLGSLPYVQDHACAMVHPTHPLARRKSVQFKETLDFDHLSAMPGSMMEIMLSRHAALAGKAIRTRIEVQSFEGVARLVAANMGIGILPREVLKPWFGVAPFKVIPLSDPWATRNFVVCFRNEPYVSVAARRVAQGLHETPNQPARRED